MSLLYPNFVGPIRVAETINSHLGRMKRLRYSIIGILLSDKSLLGAHSPAMVIAYSVHQVSVNEYFLIDFLRLNKV